MSVSAPARKGPAAPPASRHVSEQDAATSRRAIAVLERIGRLVTRALMTIGGGALVFTCVNVTLFAMLHDVPWWVAWMLDPLASIALLTVLYVDGVLAEQGNYKPSGWPFVLRWFAGLSTWLMNCWTSIYGTGFALVPQHPDPGGILLHSVAPCLLITLAEASAGYRGYLADRLAVHREVIAVYEARVREERQLRDREAAAKREREENERRERMQAEENARREREAAEHSASLDRARRREEFELGEQQRRAEIEADRERLDIAARQAEIEAATERRRAEIEAGQQRARAEIEAAERDRESARQAELIRANAEARALEERTRAELAEQEQRRREAAERRQRGRHAAPESAGVRASGSARRSASETTPEVPAFVAAITSENGGRIPREVRGQLREQAERLAAKHILNGEPIEGLALGKRFGNAETWGGDRIREARKRLAEEPGFEEEVISEALADEAAGATALRISA